MPRNKYNTKKTSKPQEIQTPTIKKKSLLIRIWENIKALRIITIISLIVSVIQLSIWGINIYEERKIEKSRAFVYKILANSYLTNQSLQDFKYNLEILKQSDKYEDIDLYNFSYGFLYYLRKGVNSDEFSKGISYINKINYESKFFKKAFLLKCGLYFKGFSEQETYEKILNTILFFQNNDIYFQEMYLMLLHIKILNNNFNEITKIYEDYKTHFPINSVNPVINGTENDILHLTINDIAATFYIDFIFNYSVLKFSNDNNYKTKSVFYFQEINKKTEYYSNNIFLGLKTVGVIDSFEQLFSITSIKSVNDKSVFDLEFKNMITEVLKQ